MNDNVRYWIATAPVGAASVLAEELAQFGADDIRERSHDVKFQGTLEVGYRTCLWSRTATRVLLSLGSIDAGSSKQRLRGGQAHRLARAFRAGRNPGLRLQRRQRIHPTHIYGSQLLKDAVCDNLRDSTGERPNIKPERPDVLLHLHVEGPTALAIAWIFPARACTGAAIAAKAGARRSRRTLPRPCCCAPDGRRLPIRAARCSIRCAVPAPFSPRQP